METFNTWKFFMQSSAGCVGNPCFFDCTAVGVGGFTCGCPQGYQVVGMCHIDDLLFAW